MMKQMRIILAKDCITEHDRKVARQILFSNMRIAFGWIEEAINKKGLDYQHQQSHVQTWLLTIEALKRLIMYRQINCSSSRWEILEMTKAFQADVGLQWKEYGRTHRFRKS